MAKKVKRINSNVNKTDKNVGKKKNSQKKKLIADDKNEHKPAIKDRNLKFKRTTKKNKLTEKIKQIHKNHKVLTPINLLNSDITKVIDVKNKSKSEKNKYIVQHKKKQLNDKQKHKKCHGKIKVSAESKSKINWDKKPVKEIKFKQVEKVKQKSEMKEKKKLNDKTIKLKQKRKSKSSNVSKKKNDDSQVITSSHNLDVKVLKKLLVNKQTEKKKEKIITKPQSLRQKMMTKLKASRFRYLNETLYNNESSESKKYFRNNPDEFKAYHEGYKQQVEQWPLNPLDIIISSIKKMPKEYIIADFGCGEANLTASVSHKVHSFDFVSLNEDVTVCDVTHTPLLTSGVHVVVFCLSLMGTNLNDYIIEANRVLKKDGILKVAEVESRFEQVEDFIKAVSSYGFKNTWKDLSHNLFYFLDFKKEKDINGKKNKLPPITLKPCLYKKR